MKLIWLDTETTGLDPEKHDLIEIAFIDEVEPFRDQPDRYCFLRMCPSSPDRIDESALAVNGYSIPEIMDWPDRSSAVDKLSNKIDLYLGHDRFLFAGWLIAFDIDFIAATVGLDRDKRNRILRHAMDVRSLAHILMLRDPIFRPAKLSLGPVAECLGIDMSRYRLHRALDDANLTRTVYHAILERLKHV